MYRSAVIGLTLVATTSLPLAAQTALPIEPGDQVRIESENLSGEFTVAGVQAEILSLQVYNNADIRGVILRDGEEMDLRGSDFDLGDTELVLRGSDLEQGQTEVVIRDGVVTQLEVRRIPLSEIREVVLEGSTIRSASTTVQVPISSLTGLEVSLGPRPRLAGAWRGARWGLLGGSVVGCALSAGDWDWCPITGAMLGVLSGVVGLMIGSASPGERWQAVPLAEQLSIAPSRNGGVALDYSISF